MIGLFVIIVISWGLLYLIEKEDLRVLGIMPTVQRIGQFVIGFLMVALIMLVNIYIETLLRDMEWRTNTYDITILSKAFVYHLKSALTEDLIFRGAILYILIRRIGINKAILISSMIFGMYHWFSYGILGERWILLFYIFLITGANGFVWAYSFHKTKSIMLGLGLHVGSNYILSCFYESQPYGQLLFTLTSKTDFTGWTNFFYSFFKGLFPAIMTFICIKLYEMNRKLDPKPDP